MPSIIRLEKDLSKNADCSPPCKGPPPKEGSPDVFVTGIPAVRVGDAYNRHCNHDRKASSGSPDVFVNGKPVHRNGDEIDCGDIGCHGSCTVYANGTDNVCCGCTPP